MPIAAIGLGVGLIGSIGQMVAAGKANKQLEALSKTDPTKSPSPVAAQRLGLAQTLLNARMPGAAYAERNIYGNQANQESNIERNATSGSQALALGASMQGATNQAFGQLEQQEAADYQRRYSNLSDAQQGVINEGDKVYQDQVRRFGDLAQIRGAQAANTANSWKSVSNLGESVLKFGLAGQGGGGGGESGGVAPLSSIRTPLAQTTSAPATVTGSGPVAPLNMLSYLNQ